jgi:hypothetical protein
MKTQMHNNSLVCYDQEKAKLGARSKKILEWMEGWEHPASDRTIKSRMGYEEVNNVQPRITELIKAGLVKEVGKIKCSTTGKTVRLVQHAKYVNQGLKQEELF